MRNLYEYIQQARRNMLSNRECLQVGKLIEADWLNRYIRNEDFMPVVRTLRDIENIPMCNTTMQIVVCETVKGGWDFETSDIETKEQEIQAFANMLIAVGKLDYY